MAVSAVLLWAETEVREKIHQSILMTEQPSHISLPGIKPAGKNHLIYHCRGSNPLPAGGGGRVLATEHWYILLY